MIYILGIITGILLSLTAILSIDKERRNAVTKAVKNKIKPETGGIIETKTNEEIIKNIIN